MSIEQLTPQHALHRSGHLIDCQGASVRVETSGITTVLTLEGEIDGHNTEWVTSAVQRFVVFRCPLVVDLSGLDFLSVSGFRALLALHRECKTEEVDWMVCMGPAFRPYLGMSSSATLPVAESVTDAVTRIHTAVQMRRPLRFVDPVKLRC